MLTDDLDFPFVNFPLLSCHNMELFLVSTRFFIFIFIFKVLVIRLRDMLKLLATSLQEMVDLTISGGVRTRIWEAKLRGEKNATE